ncbi:MAG: hypothetical protein Q8927_14310 [Bacteroidota bacterium]|nr:hypothetical protein [Bacteroidota bacterium]MDP4217372.1 hypothetical protein [Bacteroidota bacterium]MDP4247957.1 hypothetical protein [Bacteroidota bacterium]MDP4252848.1 hypothetical protein [Bacteroidota bacterium]MDP4259840.1 hypothetical protein [Bacteroidota bacterium]
MKKQFNAVWLVLLLVSIISCNKRAAPDAANTLQASHSAPSAASLISVPNIVFTLAGDTTAGFVDGIGTAARFNELNGIAIDASGNLFVADGFNRSIRKVTAAGVVSTLTGRIDSTGFIATDGSLGIARFGIPAGLAFDVTGNLFVTDIASQRIRVISGDNVGTIAGGSGDTRGPVEFDFADGGGLKAKFASPYGIAVDAAGNLYIGDQGNQRVRRVRGTNIFNALVSTFAGQKSGFLDGQDTAARFSFPSGLAIDKAGNIYVADPFNHAVRKITATGLVTTLAGNGTPGFVNGVGRAARFNSPIAVAVDNAGNVLVADAGNFSIRKITADGNVTTIAGNGTKGNVDGTAAGARFTELSGIAVDQTGVIYVTDQHRIRVITHPTVGH